MNISTNEKLLIEQYVTNESPSVGVAYLFWFLLWFVSAHRFYLGRPGTAVLQIISYFILIGFVWVIIDAFLIPGMIREQQGLIRERYRAAMTPA